MARLTWLSRTIAELERRVQKPDPDPLDSARATARFGGLSPQHLVQPLDKCREMFRRNLREQSLERMCAHPCSFLSKDVVYPIGGRAEHIWSMGISTRLCG